ncbi:MAG TPA: sensor histidine kinase [Actinomycetales bacterium]|nr:sensor histidine kinase [Actinomycetales bacterium]
MDVRSIRRRHGDLLLAAVLAAAMSVELVSWSSRGLPAALGCGLLATIPVALRRRSPLVSFVLVMLGIQLLAQVRPGFENDSMSFVLTFLLALYSLGRYATGTEAWLGVLGVAAVMLLFNLSEGGIGQTDLGDVAFLVGFVGAPWAAGLTVRLRRERETELHSEHERLRHEQEQRARRAVAEERARIARELHDVVSHAISVTVLQARGARRALTSDPDSARQALDAIEQTNTTALGDMRRLLAVLRDTEPDDAHTEQGQRAPQPSLDHLDSLLQHVRGSGVPVTVEVRGRRQPLPPGVDLSAYRIVQEALTNVLKHTARAEARVVLDYSDEALLVSVVDDGIPGLVPGTEAAGGHGLIGIRERVAVVGGEVTAGPGPDGGFEIRARLPLSVEVS